MQTAARSPGDEPKRDSVETAARLLNLRLEVWSRYPSCAPVRLSHGKTKRYGFDETSVYFEPYSLYNMALRCCFL
jgi:hypothetical protein